MSNTGGGEGEGDTSLPAHDFQVVDVQDAEPAAGIDDGLPSEPPAVLEQNPDDEGTQDTTTTEQPQQEGDQGAAPVRQAITGPPDTQSQGASSGRVPSTSGTQPARTSRVWPTLENWFGGKKKRSASESTTGATSNRPQRSNTSIPSGSRPVSIGEEPDPSGPIAPGEDPEPPGPGAPSPELVGPSRRRLNSQGSISQRSPIAVQEGNNTRPRATRTDTGLSINTNLDFLQAIGANEGATPLGPRNRPSPIGPRSAGGDLGSLPTTAVDPQLELTRRNRAFLGLYDQLRAREVVVDEQEFQESYERVRDWRFLLDADELEQLVNQGVAAVRDVVGGAAADIPVALQNAIIGEARRGTTSIRNAVTNALADERNFVVNTTDDIIRLIDDIPAPRDRRRGSSRLSRAYSLASNASQPELAPMDPRALAGRPREDLVNTILGMERQRHETEEYVGNLEDEVRQRDQEHPEALRVLQARIEENARIHREELRAIQNERNYFEQAARANSRADQARRGPGDPQPSRDNSEEPPEVNGSGTRADAAPISESRQRALNGLTAVVQQLLRGEALAREAEIRARVDTAILDDHVEPFSANAELSRAALGLRLRDLTEDNIQLTQERDEIRENETQLLDRVAALERAQASPPRSVRGSLLGSLFGSNSGRADSPPVNERSRSGSRADPATPIRNLAGELAAQGSGGSPGSSGSSESSGPASRQSLGSRRQSRASSRRSEGGDGRSRASSRQSNAPSNNSGGFRTPPEGDPAAVNPAPLRAMPEWLAAHPNGPCRDCAPIFRFPPELGELPTCGCTCDLALRNPPPPAGRSPRAASSRSRGRTGSNRSVRFADDEPAAGGSGGRRPAPLDLAAAGNVEEDNADRPNTPYPADAEGGQAEGSAGEGPAGEGPAEVAPAPGEQGETVPIQAPTDQATGQEELLVEAPPVVAAPVGRGGERCPCCGRGAYGEPPADGVRQVAFYICRNMAGQPIPQGPPNVLQGVINALGLAPIRPGPAGGDRRDEHPAGFPEPPVPGPQDRVMGYLTAIWYFILSVCLLPLQGVRYSLTLLHWFMDALHSSGEYGLYLFERYIAGRNFPCPTLARFPMWETFCLVMLALALWAITVTIAILEEVRIWKVANTQFTTEYLRGVAFRRPYPWYQLFEADPDLVSPALGWLSERLHKSYFP